MTVDNRQQTQLAYNADESGKRTRTAFVGGEYSHYCVIPDPNVVYYSSDIPLITLLLYQLIKKGSHDPSNYRSCKVLEAAVSLLCLPVHGINFRIK